MNNNKKLLYISSRVFWPPMGGHEVELYHYCRGLHERYGYTIDVYAFDSLEKLNGVEQPPFLNRVYMSKEISKGSKFKNLVMKSFLSKQKWPLQSSLYYSKENKNQIRELLKQNQYDVVIVDMIRLAAYYSAMDGTQCKKILDIDDMLSKRYKRQIKAFSPKTNIAGQYHNRLPKLFQKMMSLSFVKKMILELEIPRVEKAEEYYSQIYDQVIFVSSIETEEFNQKYKTDKAVTVSLGVDFPFFSENLPVNKISGRVTFVGNMATPANADSVRLIINDILPRCKKIDSIVIVGNCPNELQAEFAENDKVHFTGRVDDLRTEVKKGMVFLAPIAYGTGIKTKILEAMAMEMPVVTNSIGAEGIHAINGEQWYVSDDLNQLGKYVDELLQSQERCDKIGRASKDFVEKYFQWDIIFEQFKKLEL